MNPRMRFIFNKTTLVLTGDSFLVGGNGSNTDLRLDGDTEGAVARIFFRGRTTWIEQENGRGLLAVSNVAVRSPRPLSANDRVRLGSLSFQVHEPCQHSCSPLLSFEEPNRVLLDGDKFIYRVVLLYHSLRIASQPECHAAVEGLDDETVEICWNEKGDGLVCHSPDSPSSFSTAMNSLGYAEQDVTIPGQIVVRRYSVNPISPRQICLLFEPA